MLRSIIFGQRLLSPDTGTGTGSTANPAPTGSDPGQSNAGAGTAGTAPAPTPSGESSTTDKPEKTFSQADLDRIVKERLADEKRRAEAKAAADKRVADEKALADNAQWQQLAESRAAELETLKVKAAVADAYAQRLNALVDGEIAAWPAEVTALDPGKDALEARLAWLERSRPLAKKLATLPKAADTEAGKGATPPAAGQGTQQQQPATKYRFERDSDVRW